MVPLLRVSQDCNQVSAELCSHIEAQMGKEPGFPSLLTFLNSFPWTFKTKDSSFLMAVGWRLLTAPHHDSLLHQAARIVFRMNLLVRQSPLLCNTIIRGTYDFYTFYRLEASHRSYSHLRVNTRKQGSLVATFNLWINVIN